MEMYILQKRQHITQVSVWMNAALPIATHKARTKKKQHTSSTLAAHEQYTSLVVKVINYPMAVMVKPEFPALIAWMLARTLSGAV